MKIHAQSMRSFLKLALFLVAEVNACGGEQIDNRPLPERLADIDSDLTIGSTGNDVRSLHDYLTQFGYFPNDEMGRRYPLWRPAVSAEPFSASVFDERTAAAVQKLQLNLGLPPTGVVDGALRSLIKTPRCGVPDNMADLDPSDKWAPTDIVQSLVPGHFFYNAWSLNGSTFGNLNSAQAKTAIQNAATNWMQQTSLLMYEWQVGQVAEVASGIAIDFKDLGSTNTLGQTFADPLNGGPLIHINSRITWSVGGIPAGGVDLVELVQHEFGHALGLGHSAWDTAVMYPNNSATNGTGNLDDYVAISALWDTYWQLPGAGIDIAAGADGSSVWVVGTDNRPYRWNGLNWDQDVTGRLALRIAVDPAGVPWIVNSSAQIFKRTTGDPRFGDWQMMPGAGTDIGIGTNGDVWIVGLDQRALKFNPAINDFQPAPPAPAPAQRIAVSPTGKPWIVTTSNTIQSFTKNDPLSGVWLTVPGTAGDIGAGGPTLINPARGQDGAIFKTDPDFQGTVLVWDEQPGTDSLYDRIFDGSHVPLSAAWRVAGYNRGVTLDADPNALPPVPSQISVGPDGKPWVIGNNGGIYTTAR